MAAGMADLIVPGAVTGQRVVLRQKSHRRPLSVFQVGAQSSTDSGIWILHLESEHLQLSRQKTGAFKFLVSQLRVVVDILPDLSHLRKNLIDCLTNAFFSVVHVFSPSFQSCIMPGFYNCEKQCIQTTLSRSAFRGAEQKEGRGGKIQLLRVGPHSAPDLFFRFRLQPEPSKDLPIPGGAVNTRERHGEGDCLHPVKAFAYILIVNAGLGAFFPIESEGFGGPMNWGGMRFRLFRPER